ncbi:DeoR/GlpR family DNA-binding transcription regulator [Enterococcus avium]|jgi:DeoR family fructose operon transcriptional repressor|uniref:DeoR/GlpR family DNA-binding transcription regulator n=1 Tax=Enterococcus avium TaxID=33945 RepID=UPI0032E4F718
MLTDERKDKIIQLLRKNTIVKSQTLIQLLNASESTIRRDLKEMEEDGLLKRVHGGAKLNQNLSLEFSVTEKKMINIEQKQAIAKLAVAQIEENDVVYLDAGTTTSEMIPLMMNKTIRVVTNAPRHAATLAEMGIPTMILGGDIKLSTNAVLGTAAIQQLRQLRLNKAFIGINAIDANFGFTTPDVEEAMVKRTAIECSEEVFMVADHTKFNKATFCKVASIESATILTDKLPRDLKEEFKNTLIKEIPTHDLHTHP